LLYLSIRVIIAIYKKKESIKKKYLWYDINIKIYGKRGEKKNKKKNTMREREGERHTHVKDIIAM